MELKRYQRQVMDDLASYLDFYADAGDPALAFRSLWETKGVEIGPKGGNVQPYRRSTIQCPDVCLKIPTGGGKTFMAAASLKPIFDTIPTDIKLVMWLVPSKAILSQTVASLKDPQHPYRLQLMRDFGSNISVYDSDELLAGAQLSPGTMFDRLTVCVMCYASLKANNNDRLKMRQTNGALQAFAAHLRGREDPAVGEDYSLMRVFNALRPLVVLDEGHNATSTLSRKMLVELNPRFILELTATPGEYSNPIAVVTAGQLKDEHMVKIPLVVYERGEVDDALLYAKRLRDGLEAKARKEGAEFGRYLRPIVLIQAEPNRDSEAVTFQEAKRRLMEVAGIPEEHIAIKVSGSEGPSVKELLSRNCEIRYLITVNAIKEGWDCSFAYILVSLNEIGTPTAVEQIIGRIMRMPDATPFKDMYLNVCYVFAVSSRFNETLQSVAQGLLLTGFSKKDYRAVSKDTLDRFVSDDGDDTEPMGPDGPEKPIPPVQTPKPVQEPSKGDGPTPEDGPTGEGPMDRFTNGEPKGGTGTDEPRGTEEKPESGGKGPTDEEYEEMMRRLRRGIEEGPKRDNPGGDAGGGGVMPDDRAAIRECYRDSVRGLRVPYMMEYTYSRDFDQYYYRPVNAKTLTDGFKLDGKDASVDFESVRNAIVKMDVVKGTDGETLGRINFRENEREALQNALSEDADTSKAKLVDRVFNLVNTKKYGEVNSKQIRDYVARVIDNVSEDDLSSMIQNNVMAATAIRNKIDHLLKQYRIERFNDLMNSRKITTVPQQRDGAYTFPPKLKIGSRNNTPFEKALYDRVSRMDRFEENVISKVDALDNVVWWHKFADRGQDNYMIGGFINHYPDFMVYTESGRIVLVETKGNDRDGTDSQLKLDLGKAWESVLGSDYAYFMVFETPEPKIKGAITVNQLIQYLSRI